MRLGGSSIEERPRARVDAAAAEPAAEAEHGTAAADAIDPTTARHSSRKRDDFAADTFLGAELRPRATSERGLGDLTATVSLLRLVPFGVASGVLGAAISLALMDMIGLLTNLFTNLFYYQRPQRPP